AQEVAPVSIVNRQHRIRPPAMAASGCVPLKRGYSPDREIAMGCIGKTRNRREGGVTTESGSPSSLFAPKLSPFNSPLYSGESAVAQAAIPATRLGAVESGTGGALQ